MRSTRFHPRIFHPARNAFLHVPHHPYVVPKSGEGMGQRHDRRFAAPYALVMNQIGREAEIFIGAIDGDF